jgi:hypothetical protein
MDWNGCHDGEDCGTGAAEARNEAATATMMARIGREGTGIPKLRSVKWVRHVAPSCMFLG